MNKRVLILALCVLVISIILTQPGVQKPLSASWKPLLEVEYAMHEGRVTVLSGALHELDGKRIVLTGFMYPLEQTRKQSRFILSAYPHTCGFCAEGGPESLVEVVTIEPVDYTPEPVAISGLFQLKTYPGPGPLFPLFSLSEAQQEETSWW